MPYFLESKAVPVLLLNSDTPTVNVRRALKPCAGPMVDPLSLCRFIFRGCYSLLYLWVVCSANMFAYAQGEQLTPEAHYQAGRVAYDADRYEEAVAHLSQVVRGQPGFRLGEAAAYWLGKGYEALGAPEDAHEAWRAGIEALMAEETFDVQLADVYIRSVFRQQRKTEYVKATEIYQRLLENAAAALRPLEQDIVHKHIAQLVFVLPEDLREHIVGKVGVLRRGGARVEERAGKLLTRWWRSQDPLPATLWNERMVEHLERVAVAEARYAYEGDLAGFDDRGTIYVRLGEPSRTERLRHNNLMRSVSPHAGIIPKNEYWIYDHLGRYAQYLFVDRGGRYQISRPIDTLPLSLQRKRNALSTLAVHEVYDQLAWFNLEYMTLFFEADELKEDMRAVALREHTSITSLGDALTASRSRDLGALGADFFMEAWVQDRYLARQREASVPPVNSDVLKEALRLPVVTRLARFLDEEGTTRTEIYWAFPPRALMPSLGVQAELLAKRHKVSDQYLIRLTAVQRDRDYQARTITRQRYTVREPYIDDPTAVPVYTTVVRGDTTTYHLAVQWDQYMIVDRTDSPEATPTYAYIKTGAHQLDSLQPLRADPAVLEMSDLVPSRGVDPEALARGGPIRDEEGVRVAPYPFSAMMADTSSLALYFEVYHLTFGADDQTHFMVEYEVTRREKRGGIAGLLGKSKNAVTSARTHYTGHARTTREYILLDSEDWEGEGSLTITVRVTDETTGQQIERAIEFTRGKSS